MLVSTSPKPDNNSMSSGYYYHRYHTPSRSSPQQYDPLMLTPPPFRRTTINPSLYDTLQSPCKLTAQAQAFDPFFTNMSTSQKVPADDKKGPIFPPDPKSATRIRVGAKRKYTPHLTPFPQHNITLLKLATTKDSSVSPSLDGLSPLASPKFIVCAPQTKAETDFYLKRQTATLTRLKISDNNNIVSDNELDRITNDCDCEMDNEDSGHPLFFVNKGKEDEEVAEVISPDGHIIKRRARSRPISAELLEVSFKPPRTPIKTEMSLKRNLSNRLRNAVAFPGTAHRGHASPASSSDVGSPRARRRITGNVTLVRPQTGQLQQIHPLRAPSSPIESANSGTLFFGPLIPPPQTAAPAVRSRTNTNISAATPAPVSRRQNAHGNPTNRHSYAGPESNANALHVRNVSQTRNVSPSPKSSFRHVEDVPYFDTDMGNVFLGSENSSFILNAASSSPQSQKTLPIKYKSVTGNSSQAVPKMSVCSDDGLGAASEDYSRWLPAVAGDNQLTSKEEADVDAFIIKTLAAASKGPQLLPKKVPGTPVKKPRISCFSNERLWQSAIAPKVGLPDDSSFNKKRSRRSLPALFPSMGAKSSKLTCEQTSDSEDEESPITRRDNRWLTRRSSSGAFSSGGGSASLANTPTRFKGIDWHLPRPRMPLRLSPSSDTIKVSSQRSNSGTWSSSIPALNLPTDGKQCTVPLFDAASRPTPVARRLSDSFAEEQPGRFERDFVEIKEVGSGEFGKVIQVQRKGDGDVELYAIKKSKQFEGTKHRLRLREEVDVLKHLSQVARLSLRADGRHPNVLAYVDSWEEDEALYIRTELCELGNLARFLWEYGRAFPRLDEAKVWKVIVDLSSGLRFIHDSGVIHLDLKPSNVFITKEGRFKIGDFGMASFWPRPRPADTTDEGDHNFEREGDKLYLAPEVLQGRYGKAADVFSFGMMILETASNIVVPDQGEAWQRLRREDLSQVDLDGSPELVDIIKAMMHTDPSHRMSAGDVCLHPVVVRTREKMEALYEDAKRNGRSVFGASPLASVPRGFLEDVLCRMDTSSV